MEAKRGRQQSTQEKAAAAAASVAVISLVLGDGDLLGEIFLRLALPSSLVRAALVCKRWLRAASDPAFLRRFRDLHPPGLLGCYLSIRTLHLGLASRRTSSSAGTDDTLSTSIVDCRNGWVVTRLYHGDQSVQGANSPLRPGRGMVILSKEDGMANKATAYVYMLQAGAWHIHTSATTHLPKLGEFWLQPLSIFLTGDNIYMAITMHKILVLDLASSTFFTVGFPDGMVVDRHSVLSPAHALLWLHRGKDGKGSMGDWLLVHAICLRDMCSSLGLPSSTTEDGHNTRIVNIQVLGDNAEFVFLEIYGWLVHLDVRSRAWQKVYEMPEKDTYLCWIHPFMMIWPPFFPVLEE
ncbi:hypothetical protein GQ55_1G128200 [Panicum hallii var. hallii]|uniref:Uncharacterized protein n=1 Tax=Panicum hallii var. hallii TaxID=1504633 RepID=A0A2T7F535_9POAL|nr:hypothetical protein GQ55_1G128200 [Panicum hallii var. hallii]